MSYDASARNLRCPFCSSEKLTQQKDGKTLRAKVVVPFSVSTDNAQGILRKWLGASFWRPSDLAERAVITRLSKVYVPYWVFSASTHTYWTADSSHTPFGARGDWVPYFGDHRSRYSGVLIGASGALTPSETSNLCPFDISRGVSRDDIQLEEAIVERFVVQRKYARPLARASIESLERESCRKYVPGRSRNVKVNVKLHGLHSTPVLLPIWIMAYHYKGELYRFLINGQSGRHTGRAPFSYLKLAMVIGGVAAAVLLLMFIILIFTAIANQ